LIKAARYQGVLPTRPRRSEANAGNVPLWQRFTG
jgi:hypothetical protein